MIANCRKIPNVHFVSGDQPLPQPQFLSESAAVLGKAMRLAVTDGTAMKAMMSPVVIAGKTGTVEGQGGAVPRLVCARIRPPADASPLRCSLKTGSMVDP
jgi:hypothetical protein